MTNFAWLALGKFFSFSFGWVNHPKDLSVPQNGQLSLGESKTPSLRCFSEPARSAAYASAANPTAHWHVGGVEAQGDP